MRLTGGAPDGAPPTVEKAPATAEAPPPGLACAAEAETACAFWPDALAPAAATASLAAEVSRPHDRVAHRTSASRERAGAMVGHSTEARGAVRVWESTNTSDGAGLTDLERGGA